MIFEFICVIIQLIINKGLYIVLYLGVYLVRGVVIVKGVQIKTPSEVSQVAKMLKARMEKFANQTGKHVKLTPKFKI